MNSNGSATQSYVAPLSGRPGIAWASLGVLAFSFTVPLTHVAVLDLDPLFVGSGRAVVAGILAAVALTVTRQKVPARSLWIRLALVALGTAVGFSLLTSFALRSVPSSHAAVVIGLLPAATAVLAVLRGRERPSARFWLASAAGAVAVVVFIAVANGGLGSFHRADALLIGAVVCAAVGYSEGALLAREIGAWQTVSWALVLALPVTITLCATSISSAAPHGGGAAWLSFAYLSCVSMYLGFFPWYRGLAIGPVSTVSQTQLVQPVLSIIWAALILGESVGLLTVFGGGAVIACAWLALQSRVRSSTVDQPYVSSTR